MRADHSKDEPHHTLQDGEKRISRSRHSKVNQRKASSDNEISRESLLALRDEVDQLMAKGDKVSEKEMQRLRRK